MRFSTSFLLALSLVACDGGGGPTLAPLDPASGRVNEALRIELVVDNPSGVAVDLRVESGDIPSFDAVTALSANPGGGTFTWTPLSSHVGMHELTFVLTAPDGGEYDRQTVLIEVLPADDAAPVFVAPGAGGTYDLTGDPCVSFDVEVRDDDSERVEIRARAALPEGATLANAGPKRASFDWCPSPDQVAASERWTIQLAADDGGHPPVEHNYVVVLRSGGGRDGCPGDAPTITLERPLASERVTSSASFEVEVTIEDDRGLRDAPLLHYTTTAPADLDDPDVTQFELAAFADHGGGTYVAHIPSLGLAEGEDADVYYLVSATDNDDTSGSLCDHRTDSELVAFVAVGGDGGGGLDRCEPCSASAECGSGICAATASGGRCVDACSGDGVCGEGTCGATVTTEGATRAGCGPAGEVCGGGAACTDDAREEDDDPASATPYSSEVLEGQICGGDDDYFAIDVPGGNRVTVTALGWDAAAADLDLQLSRDGTILGSSAGISDEETVSYCNGDGPITVHARVYGYGASQSPYLFEAEVAPDPGGCCADDAEEDDDTRTTARAIDLASGGLFDGTICPMDDDWGTFTVSSASTVEVTILLATDAPSGDLDVELYAADGRLIDWSRGVGDVESLTADVGPGTYAVRVYGYLESTNVYAGEVVVR